MVINFTKQFVSGDANNITEITTLSSISHFERITHLFEMCKTMYNFITQCSQQDSQPVIVIVANAQYTSFALLLMSSFLSYHGDTEFVQRRPYRTTMEAYQELKKFILEKSLSKVLVSDYTKQHLELLPIFEPSVIRYCKFFNYLTRVPIPDVQALSLDYISIPSLEIFKKDALRKKATSQTEELLSFADPFTSQTNIYFVLKQNNKIVFSTNGIQPETAHIQDKKNDQTTSTTSYVFNIPKGACQLIGDFILFGYQMDELGTIQQLFRYTYNTLFVYNQDSNNMLSIEKNRLDWAHINQEIIDNFRLTLKFSFVRGQPTCDSKVTSYKTELESTVKSCPYYLKGNKAAIRLAHVTNQAHRRNMKGIVSELDVFTKNLDSLLKKVEKPADDSQKRLFSTLDTDDKLLNIFTELHLTDSTKKNHLRSPSFRGGTPDKRFLLPLSPSSRPRRSTPRKGTPGKVGTPSRLGFSPAMKEQQLLHFTPPTFDSRPNKENEFTLLDMNDPIFDECLKPSKSTVPPPPSFSSVPPPPVFSSVPPPPALQPLNTNVPPPPPSFALPLAKKEVIKKKEEDNNIKKLHWQPIKVTGENSVWSSTNIDENLLDLGEFQKMFAKEEAVKPTKMPSKTTEKTSSILELGTARNVEIILNSQFKTFSNEQIIELVNILDTSVLSLQQVENLKRLVAIANDLGTKRKQLEEKDTLLRTEKFLLDILSVRNIDAKIKVIGYMHTLDSTVDTLVSKIKRKNEAVSVVRNSTSFAKVLKYILTFGNFMNRGKRQLEANGFHISVLPKLRDTKSSTNKEMSLVHYLVSILEKDGVDMYTFERELETAGVTSFAVSNTVENIETLFLEFKHIHSQVDYLYQVSSDEDRELFQSRLSNFHARCTPLLPSIAEMFESLQSEYKECCEYFHFTPSKIAKNEEDEFFAYIKEFVQEYKKAKKDVEQRKLNEAKQALNLQRTSSLSQLVKRRKKEEEEEQEEASNKLSQSFANLSVLC